MTNFKQYITINPRIRFGKPTIAGTRIMVYDVINWLENGMTISEIIEDFPELTEEQIKACYLYSIKKNNKNS